MQRVARAGREGFSRTEGPGPLPLGRPRTQRSALARPPAQGWGGSCGPELPAVTRLQLTGVELTAGGRSWHWMRSLPSLEVRCGAGRKRQRQ